MFFLTLYQGDGVAGMNIDDILKDRQGITKDLEQATERFDRAAMHHNVEAQLHHPICVIDGQRMQKDERNAIMPLRGAANREASQQYTSLQRAWKPEK
jgi:TPR repeat protein